MCSQPEAEAEFSPLVRRNVALAAMVQRTGSGLAVCRISPRDGSIWNIAMPRARHANHGERGELRERDPSHRMCGANIASRTSLNAMPGQPFMCKYKQSYTLRRLYNSSTRERYASGSPEIPSREENKNYCPSRVRDAMSQHGAVLLLDWRIVVLKSIQMYA